MVQSLGRVCRLACDQPVRLAPNGLVQLVVLVVLVLVAMLVLLVVLLVLVVLAAVGLTREHLCKERKVLASTRSSANASVRTVCRRLP